MGKNGEFFVSDTGCLGLLGIDPRSGEQRLISTGGILGIPFGIAVERSGMILVANAQSVLARHRGATDRTATLVLDLDSHH